jgi:hypothetical protein
MSRISQLAKRTPAPLGRALHSTAVASELAIIRMRDRAVPPKEPGELRDLTAVVKTFERPHVLGRLLRSVKRYYPGLAVVVADDSRRPRSLPGVDTVELSFNCGVSVGRNAALARVTTEFVLLLDDDYILSGRSNVDGGLEAIRRQPEIDIMGGKRVDLPLLRTFDYSRPALHKKVPPPSGDVGGFPIYNIVPNFFIARTERLRLVGWDPAIRMLDHTDFFSRAHGVLTTVYNAGMSCYHANTPFDRRYMHFRRDVSHDHDVLRKRWKA